MEDLFRSYWWLLFPIGFFIFGAWDRWLAYKRSKDQLDLLRAYTNQGKDPPPELLRVVREAALDDDDDDYGFGSGRRRHRRYWRYSPYHAWRTAVITAAVAVGFWIASEYGEIPGLDAPFRLVAIIMTCVAAGHAIAALFASVLRRR